MGVVVRALVGAFVLIESEEVGLSREKTPAIASIRVERPGVVCITMSSATFLMFGCSLPRSSTISRTWTWSIGSISKMLHRATAKASLAVTIVLVVLARV